MRHIVLGSFLFLLTGCLESEKSCYERLSTEFSESAEWAMEEARKKTGEEALSYLEYAQVASKSALRITSIWIDDDMDACDYYSDGPYVRKK